MTQSSRKFLGTFLTLIVLIVYIVLAVQIYERLLIGQPSWLLLIYFCLAGLGWVFPAMALIRWMSKPDQP